MRSSPTTLNNSTTPLSIWFDRMMKLTSRDRFLFEKLHDYGMLSTAHINQFIFGGIAKTTTLRRLRILEQAKLIQRIGGLESGQYLWILSTRGAELMGRSAIKRNWNRNLLDHDYKLLCLRLLIEKNFTIVKWTGEHELRHIALAKYGVLGIKNKLIPDSIFMTSLGGEKNAHALELELTLKSKDRIRSVLRRYLEKSGLTNIFYVCANQGILRSVLQQWKVMSYGLRNAKLYGVLHAELISSPKLATLHTLHQALPMKAILPAHSTAHPMSTVSTEKRDPFCGLSSERQSHWQGFQS
jgi:hypothetical protein